jgi:hypothetical protein
MISIPLISDYASIIRPMSQPMYRVFPFQVHHRQDSLVAGHARNGSSTLIGQRHRGLPADVFKHYADLGFFSQQCTNLTALTSDRSSFVESIRLVTIVASLNRPSLSI